MSAPIGSTCRTGFDRLLSHAHLALEFVQEARLAQQPDRKWCSLQSARVTLDALTQLTGEQSLSAEQAGRLEETVAEVERGLREFQANAA